MAELPPKRPRNSASDFYSSNNSGIDRDARSSQRGDRIYRDSRDSRDSRSERDFRSGRDERHGRDGREHGNDRRYRERSRDRGDREGRQHRDRVEGRDRNGDREPTRDRPSGKSAPRSTIEGNQDRNPNRGSSRSRSPRQDSRDAAFGAIGNKPRRSEERQTFENDRRGTRKVDLERKAAPVHFRVGGVGGSKGGAAAAASSTADESKDSTNEMDVDGRAVKPNTHPKSKTNRKAEPAYEEEGEENVFVEEDADAQAMAAMMGFGGFGSTAGKKVLGNNVSAVRKEKVTEYRQYMNRVGGFNRPLDEL